MGDPGVNGPEARSGPVIIGYDGSPTSERALVEAGLVLGGRRALVVVVWEPGPVFELAGAPSPTPAPLDIRTALEAEEKIYDGVRRLADHGAALARELGLEAEGLAVADDITPAATLVRLARERQAPALVVGTRGHRGVRHLLLGSTAEAVVRTAPCPVVVRGPGPEGRGEGYEGRAVRRPAHRPWRHRAAGGTGSDARGASWGSTAT